MVFLPVRLPAQRMLLLWTITRLVMLVLLLGPESRIVGDVVYFTRTLRHLTHGGPLSAAMPEYPLPAVLVVALPWLAAVALGHVGAYGFAFLTFALVVDLCFAEILRRSVPAGTSSRAVGAWLVLGTLVGGLSLVRFDIVPGVMVGLAVLFLGRRPRTAAALVALATSVKLWPALLIPAVLAQPERRRPPLVVGALVGAAAIGGTALLAGWERVWSPLVYQKERGLQIESLVANPLMLRHWASPSDYDVFYSAYKAYEISGPGEHFMLAVSSLLLVAYVVVVGACWWRVARMGRALTPDALVWSTLTLTLGFLCVSKVLSPQYLLWLTPTACVGLAVVTRVRPMLRWVGLLAVAVGLSHLLYPALYTALALPERDTWIAMVVLTARNVLLLALLVLAAVEAWRATRPVEVGDEASAVGGEEHQPDGRARLGTS